MKYGLGINSSLVFHKYKLIILPSAHLYGMPRKTRSQKPDELGHEEDTDSEDNESGSESTKSESTKSTLEAILQGQKALDEKMSDLATKECINELKKTIVEQNEKIQILEAKIVLLENYASRIEKLERSAEESDSYQSKIEDLELRCDEQEQYQRRLCLRFNDVEYNEEVGESGAQCLEKVKKMIKDELKLDIPDMAFDRAHRIGQTKEDPQSHKKFRQIIVRFTTWRHRSLIYKARKNTKKFKVRLDLTYRRAKLIQCANEWLEKEEDSFAFADLNCRLCVKLNDDFRYFNTKDELLELIKYV